MEDEHEHMGPKNNHKLAKETPNSLDFRNEWVNESIRYTLLVSSLGYLLIQKIILITYCVPELEVDAKQFQNLCWFLTETISRNLLTPKTSLKLNHDPLRSGSLR